MRKYLLATAVVISTAGIIGRAHASGVYKLSIALDGTAMCFWAGNECRVTPRPE